VELKEREEKDGTLLSPPRVPNVKKLSSLQKSVWDENLEEVIRFFQTHSKAKIKLTAVDKHGRTALHLACIHGNVEIARVLLDEGAEINARDTFQRTSLLVALKSKHLECAKFLLERHADVEVKDAEDMTALHFLASMSLVDVPLLLNVIGRLLEEDRHREFLLTSQTLLGESPLLLALKSGMDETCKELIVKYHANMYLHDGEGRNILILAIRRRLVETLKTALNMIDVKDHLIEKDIYGKSAVDYARQTELPEIMSLIEGPLMEAEANLRLKKRSLIWNDPTKPPENIVEERSVSEPGTPSKHETNHRWNPILLRRASDEVEGLELGFHDMSNLVQQSKSHSEIGARQELTVEPSETIEMTLSLDQLAHPTSLPENPGQPIDYLSRLTLLEGELNETRQELYREMGNKELEKSRLTAKINRLEETLWRVNAKFRECYATKEQLQSELDGMRDSLEIATSKLHDTIVENERLNTSLITMQENQNHHRKMEHECIQTSPSISRSDSIEPSALVGGGLGEENLTSRLEHMARAADQLLRNLLEREQDYGLLERRFIENEQEKVELSEALRALEIEHTLLMEKMARLEVVHLELARHSEIPKDITVEIPVDREKDFIDSHSLSIIQNYETVLRFLEDISWELCDRVDDIGPLTSDPDALSSLDPLETRLHKTSERHHRELVQLLDRIVQNQTKNEQMFDDARLFGKDAFAYGVRQANSLAQDHHVLTSMIETILKQIQSNHDQIHEHLVTIRQLMPSMQQHLEQLVGNSPLDNQQKLGEDTSIASILIAFRDHLKPIGEYLQNERAILREENQRLLIDNTELKTHLNDSQGSHLVKTILSGVEKTFSTEIRQLRQDLAPLCTGVSSLPRNPSSGSSPVLSASAQVSSSSSTPLQTPNRYEIDNVGPLLDYIQQVRHQLAAI
jgi:hypothetical protein